MSEGATENLISQCLECTMSETWVDLFDSFQNSRFTSYINFIGFNSPNTTDFT